jgi:hypothetical protein
LSDSAPSHFYFSPRCLFCNKNNGRRNSKKGRYWKCRHCGETNPGPGMLRAIVGRFTTPASPTNGKHSVTPTAPAAQPAVALATTIKGVPPVNEAVTPPKPKPPSRKAASVPTAPPPKPGLLERVMYG